MKRNRSRLRWGSALVSLLLAGCLNQGGTRIYDLPHVDDAAVPIDVNGDGRDDILQPTAEGLSVYLNQNGKLAAEAKNLELKAHRKMGELLPGATLSAGDFNHDGKCDVMLWESLRTQVWLNQSGPLQKFESPSSLILADMNGDGTPDIVKRGDMDRFRNTKIELLLGTDAESLQFEEGSSINAVHDLQPFAVPDLDGDGIPDLALESPEGLSLYSHREGRFKKQTTSKYEGALLGWASLEESKPAYMFRWIDEQGLVIFGNSGDFRYREVATLPIPRRPSSLALGQLNDDETWDLVALPPPKGVDDIPPPPPQETTGFYLFLAEEGPKFGTPQTAGVRPSAATVKVGDFDGKKAKDLFFFGFEPKVVVFLR